MTAEDFEELIEETFEHLGQGRFRMALTSAKRVYEEFPEDYRSSVCLAWALMENGNSAEALEFANLSVRLSSNNINARTYRGYLLTRMSLYEGALSDLNYAIKNDTPLSEMAFKAKAAALAGMGDYGKALEVLENKINSEPETIEPFKYLIYLLNIAVNIEKPVEEDINLYKTAAEAFRQKEYWFSYIAAKKIQDTPSLKHIRKEALLLELDSLFLMFRVREALDKAEIERNTYKKDKKFDYIYSKILKSSSEGKIIKPMEKKVLNGRTDIEIYPGPVYKVYTAKTYNFIDNLNSGRRVYLLQFNEDTIRYIGVEIVIDNPFYKKRTFDIDGMAVWYLNNIEAGRNRFILGLEKEWRTVEFVQNWGTNSSGFWTEGQGQVDIYLEDKKICTRYFLIGSSQLMNFEESPEFRDSEESGKRKFTSLPGKVKKYIAQTAGYETVESLLGEIEELTGIQEVKISIKDFIDYLRFITERKKSGLNNNEKFSINCIFSGNPGTGKITTAWILGRVLKSMGTLRSGHLIETDWSGLTGKDTEESAQKMNHIIEEAAGGILFIKNADSIIQEDKDDYAKTSVELLLRILENRSGELSVISSVDPAQLNTFIDFYPGIKSLFPHIFNFEDLTPDELTGLFKKIAAGEDYVVPEESEKLLKKEFTLLQKKRDGGFKNAKLIKNYLSEIKIQIGKRYLKIPAYKRTREAMCTIYPDDVSAVLRNRNSDKDHPGIDEDLLRSSLEQLNKLTGLESVKSEINEIIKLAKFFVEEGENPENKFLSHFVFMGNPGTGKTTIARIFSQIYCALGILPKGHLVETDRQGLVGVYVGQTAQKTAEMIDKAGGGTLFIDEAYTLSRKGSMSANDFGNEAIETLLKRMEDERGKFIVIAAGYTEQMNSFLDSNPGLQSRFTRKILFEDFSPEELLKMTEDSLKEKGHLLVDEAREQLFKFYNRIFREREKNFGNARLVRDLVDRILKNHLLRVADIPYLERTEFKLREISIEDVLSVTADSKSKTPARIQGDSELLDEYLTELSELAGLESVKNSVRKLVSSLKVAKLREEKGLKIIPKNLHSVFVGNPGTGKTTIARLLSKIYKEMGVLEKGHLVEVDRSGLVAGYQGQTAIKTDAVIQQALGGTLFIDEAYSLARGANDFGQEAIDTLIKRMEDYQGRFVVIVAGYTNEMKEFIESNPGLKSRFTSYYNFEDYSPRQLLEIALVITGKNGYNPDEGAWQLLLDICTELYGKRDKNFGNARMVRNILYKAISNQEERILTLYNPDTEDLSTIIYDDVAKIDLAEL
ncbi:MAG TPA: AAA family ATPase [Ignavibacteriaceae bacterium]|nr:AAA family ATPase [Ignavibacteriaceae bacterium]